MEVNIIFGDSHKEYCFFLVIKDKLQIEVISLAKCVTFKFNIGFQENVTTYWFKPESHFPIRTSFQNENGRNIHMYH